MTEVSGDERVLRQDAGGLCTLTLNRPDKLNALDGMTFAALNVHLAAIEADEGIGCVVLRGAGRAFCAGADLQAFGEKGGSRPGERPGIVERLANLRQPVIAAVQGACMTGGLELALAADFIVADESARFADTHGKWGLVGAWGISQRLPRRIGIAQAKRMMMTGYVLDGEAAREIGLVDLLAPAGGLDDLLTGFTADILANSWHSNFSAKAMLIATDGMSLAQGLAHEQYRHPGAAPDYRERIAAFKRG